MLPSGITLHLHKSTGEWWNNDLIEVEAKANETGGAPNISNAFTINGQPGDLYSCSTLGTHFIFVRKGIGFKWVYLNRSKIVNSKQFVHF